MKSTTIVKSKPQQIQEFLLDKIQRQQLKTGQNLPSEQTLCEQFGVSRYAVRQAISGLVQGGALESVAGVGHVVRSSRISTAVALLAKDMICLHRSPFHSLLFTAIRKELTRHKCHAQLYFPSTEAEDLRLGYHRLNTSIRRKRFAGAIGIYWPDDIPENVTDSDRLVEQLLKERQIPRASIAGPGIPASTGMDHFSLGYLGTRYFLERGIKRIGLVRHKLLQDEVFNGHRQALKEFDVRPPRNWTLLIPNPTQVSAYNAFVTWWGQVDQPDALVVSDDIMAQAVIIAALALNIQIPDTLQLACHWVKDSGILLPRPVVRLQVDADEYARGVVGQLMTMIRNPGEQPASIQLKPQVVEPSDQSGPER